MKTKCLSLLLTLFIYSAQAQSNEEKPQTKQEKAQAAKEQAQLKRLIDSVYKSLKFETGTVNLAKAEASLNIPQGFKFLGATQSKMILEDIWGNPPGNDDVLGMVAPASSTVVDDSQYVFIVQYDAMGYVKDEDADKINYDDMLKDVQGEEAQVNAERRKQGYPTSHLVGWAAKPFYDKDKRVLHWAKEIKFEQQETNTLNYNIRVLGRKGVLVLNAVSQMSMLPAVQKDIDKALGMVEFNSGSKYTDFNSSTDKIAAVTIGGLVAGKVLAKVGLLAGLAKFGKVIVLGIIAGFAGLRKLFSSKKDVE